MKIYIGEGIGNIIMTTPMIQAFVNMGYKVSLNIRPSSPSGFDVLKGWKLIDWCDESDVDIEVFTYWYKHKFAGIADTKNKIYSKIPNWNKISEIELNMEIAVRLGYKGNRPPTYVSVPQNIFKNDVSDMVIMSIGTFPNKVSSRKRWDYWNDLISRFPKVGLVGSKNDIYPNITAEVVDYRGIITLQETFQCIRDCNFFIGIDSGLVHAANAVGTKAFAIFGYTSEKKNQPALNVIPISKRWECQPCKYSKTICDSGRKCLECLTADDVYNKIQENLNE